jgi:outer membrane protein OmpA-like peptidoglycan-associated protein
MPGRPVLDDLELELVQKIDSEQDQDLVQTGVPGLDGDFLASNGRRATRFTLIGVVAGDEAGEGLKKLREKFAIAEPVPFVSDIATATKVDKVLIEEMGVRELAGRPSRFEYSFTLREFKPAPPPVIIIIPPPPPQRETCLEVTVIVEDDPNFDFSTITIAVTGTSAAGAPVNITLGEAERNGNVWTKEDMPAGTGYTAVASTQVPEQMSGSTTFNVEQDVCPNTAVIILRRGVKLGSAYLIHYRFDKSFVEPCLRAVLREVADRARTGPADEKILIVGHTDLTGSDEYNQSLSERRARGVFAFLMYGQDPAAAVAEWNHLRRPQVNFTRTINDNWGTRQYQYMLQDLNFYNDRIDGVHASNTTAAVRRFQQSKGLPQTGAVDDATWPVLIDDYMKQDSLRIDPGKFLVNCSPELLKWLGCGEKDPVVNTENALRQNRRTEIVFARVTELPCRVAPPVTLNLPAAEVPPPAGFVGQWCLGADGDSRTCFLRRAGDPEDSRILVSPANPATMQARGRMRFEDGRPAAGVRYVLVAPDGEFMDGEVPSGASRGEPREGITDADGRFAYPRDKGVGVWIMEVQANVLARLEEEPPSRARGNVVCKRMDGSSEFNIILSSRPASFEFVDATDVERTIDATIFEQPFLLRADVPGETRDEITVELMSYLIRR